jgi:hypothetical protein
MTQERLPLQARRDQEAATRLEADVYEWLSDGNWHTAITFGPARVDRMLRIVAERSQGRIISGQYGYKLTKYATTEEIDHAERWLLSQGRKMIDRAREIRIARNRSGAAA